MTFPYGGVSVTVQRASYDRYNDPTYTDHHDIPNAFVYSVSSVESGLAVTDRRAMIVPSGSDVQPTDRIKVGTVIFQVKGLPEDWVHPLTGWAPGMEVSLERVT